jgi:acetolactate synthase I/II/III large subunit
VARRSRPANPIREEGGPEILKREGVEWVIGYPVNHILERAAAANIRPIIVRQERTGLHMAEAISRVTN